MQLCQILLFLHYFSDLKMLSDLPFRMNLSLDWSGSGTLACQSSAQASWIVRVASLPCRRRRSPTIFRQKNTWVSEPSFFWHFCKLVCCWVRNAMLMRRCAGSCRYGPQIGPLGNSALIGSAWLPGSPELPGALRRSPEFPGALRSSPELYIYPLTNSSLTGVRARRLISRPSSSLTLNCDPSKPL